MSTKPTNGNYLFLVRDLPGNTERYAAISWMRSTAGEKQQDYCTDPKSLILPRFLDVESRIGTCGT